MHSCARCCTSLKPTALAFVTLVASFSIDSCNTFAGHQAEREAREQAEREKLRWWLNVVTKWYEWTWFVFWLCCSLRQYVCHSTGAWLRVQLDANSIRTLQDTWDLKGNMSCSHCMRFGSGYKAKHWYQRFAKHWMTPWRAAIFLTSDDLMTCKILSTKVWLSIFILNLILPYLPCNSFGKFAAMMYHHHHMLGHDRYANVYDQNWTTNLHAVAFACEIHQCPRVITRPKRNALQNHILGRFVLILRGCNRILGWIALMRRLLIAKFSSSTTLPTMVVAERRPIHYLLIIVGKNAKSKARIPAVKAWR